MTNIPWNTSLEHRETQQNSETPIFWEIQIWELKHPSYVRPDWTPFTVWWEPIIVISCEGNSARVIMNLLDISNSIIEVVWENNEPKVVNLNWDEFLCKIYIDSADKIKVTLISNKILLPHFFYDYPLEIIKEDNFDMLVVRKNELFYQFLFVKEFKVSSEIFYKKWDKYLPVTFEWEDSLHNFIWVPNVEGMSLWERNNRRLIYWDKDAETFKQVEKWEIVFENVNIVDKSENLFSIRIWENVIQFSPSLDNPNQPASIEINWKFFLVKYIEKDKSIANIFIWDNDYGINVNEPIIINWRTFYNLDESYFTDWLEIFDFKLDKNNEIKTVNYQGDKFPILNDLCSYDKVTEPDSFIRICFIDWDITKEIILMKNPKYNPDEEEKWEKNEETKKIDEYIRLKLTPDQSKKHLINTSYIHWIICLSDHSNSRTKQEFYRINSDWTLSLVFIDANDIVINDNVILAYYDRELRFTRSYILIRRPGTSSIFEPVDYNGKFCLMAKWKNKEWTVTYISIENFSEIVEQYTWPDPEIVTFIPHNKFELWWETLFYNDDWTINLLDKKFHLVNSRGKFVDSPEKAIFKVWDKEILLLVNKDDTIVGYFVWMKTDLDMLDLRHYIKTSPDLLESIKREVIKVSVDGVEAICNMNYPEFRALRICEIVNEYFYNRYVWNVWNADKISWKEFMCDWEQIEIQEMCWKEYVLDKKWELYYRPDLWNELTKVILPERTYLSNNNIPYVKPRLYNYIPQNKWPRDWKFPLKIVKWEIKPIKWSSTLYRLDMEDFDCIINWVEKTFINLWNYKTNQICSYTEESWGFEAFKITNHKTFFDDNNIRIYTDWDIDVCKNIFGRNIILTKIKAFNGEYRHLIIHEQIKTEDYLFAKVWNSDRGGERIYPLYNVDWTFIAIEILEWYKFEFKNWKILINGIPYGDNELKLFYEKFRPEQIDTKWVVEKVTWKVKDLTQE